MAFFTNPSSKFERAVRALFVLQGKATWDNTRLSNDSNPNTFPNRKFVCTGFAPKKVYRPEGWCYLDIQHFTQGAEQPDELNGVRRKEMDAYVGDTMDTLLMGGTTEQDLGKLADSITAAGRWLAQDDPTDTTGAAARIAADNADMVNFRCDEVQFSSTAITRGKPDGDGTYWVEIVHLSGFCSHAST